MTGKKDANQTAEPTVEIYPDSWERFERAVDAAVKSGPKHRPAKEQTKVAPSEKTSKAKGR